MVPQAKRCPRVDEPLILAMSPGVNEARRSSRAASSRGPSCREQLLDCLSITTCGALLAVALRPFQNTPFIDDWVYAWSVVELLEHGRLRVLDWSAHVNVAQVLWGAAFGLPLGFSFTALSFRCGSA